MKKAIVEAGKIVTIIFEGPAKKPLDLLINNNEPYLDRMKPVYISPRTPLAQAIINRKVGEWVTFNSPEGRLKVRIIGIS